jgi:hypothetical protein
MSPEAIVEQPGIEPPRPETPFNGAIVEPGDEGLDLLGVWRRRSDSRILDETGGSVDGGRRPRVPTIQGNRHARA